MSFGCRVDGSDSSLVLADDGASLGERWIPWVDVDRVEEAGHSVIWHIASGLDPATTPVVISHLGEKYDECAEHTRDLRSAARRASLTQTPQSPLASFIGRRGEAIDDVHVLRHAISIETRGGASIYLPWGLVSEVERSGYSFTVHTRGIEPCVVGGFGERSDEFATTVERVRASAAEAMGDAFAAAGVDGFRAPDGWAQPVTGAGAALVSVWAGMKRSAEFSLLNSAADELRLGLWTEGGDEALPFVLARVGDRIAVEAVDADDRATFVFASDDVDQVNAALTLTSFRREVLSADPSELGRWVVAVRTSPVVRWLRRSLIARIIHDSAWGSATTAALVGPRT